MKAETRTKAIQWAIFLTLGTIGMFAFFMLAGDEDPNHPMSLTQFFIIKAAALAALCGCYKAGQKLEQKGLLPKFEDEPEEEWED